VGAALNLGISSIDDVTVTRVLVTLLAIPLFAFGVAWGLIWQIERDWQEALAVSYQNVSAEQRAARTLARVCDDPRGRSEMEDACRVLEGRRWMRLLAAVTGVAGPVWLAVIAAAGRIARTRRALLLYVFRPLLQLTNVFLILFIAANGALAVAVVVFGEAALIGRVHFLLVGIVAVSAIVGVLSIVARTFSLVRVREVRVLAKPVHRRDAPALWDLVDTLAARVGTQPPDHIVVGLEPTFFVTVATVQTVAARLNGRTLFFSLTLARILRTDEVRGILGHELGHFKGEDTKFSTKFYPIYHGTVESLRTLAAMGGTGATGVPLIPAIAILSFFFREFVVAETALGSERELAADTVGASLIGERAMGIALIKVCAFVGRWESIRKEMAGGLRAGGTLASAVDVGARAAQEMTRLEALEALGERLAAHPTDLHPPLADRLANLGISLREVEAAALDTEPDDRAIAVLSDHEAIAQELVEMERRMVERAIGDTAIPRSALGGHSAESPPDRRR